MRIHYFSRAAAFPFLLLLVYFFVYAQYQSATAGSYILIPSVTCLVLLYIFHDQIDQWWWKRQPPRLEKALKEWLLTFSPFYSSLSEANKARFESRLSIFLQTKDFTLKEKKDFHLEEDTKALIAYHFIRISWTHEQFLFKPYGHFVVYNHSFGTPDYPFLHSFEYHEQDGVVIYARDMLLLGIDQGRHYFDIGLYGAIAIFINIFPRLDYPSTTDLSIEHICSILNIDVEGIYSALGYKEVSKVALLCYAFFNHFSALQKGFPAELKKIEAIFT
jgi:hypothetical protein